MGLSVKKSLLGFEDIFFDTLGNGAIAQVLKSDGITYREVQKINDTHIPIIDDNRALLGGATNIAAAFLNIIERLSAAAGDASTTAKGLIEIATGEEVNKTSGLSSTLAVTPFTLAGRVATTAMTGLIQLATEAETLDGADANKAVSPATLNAALDAFNATLTESGRLAQHGLVISNNVSDASHDIDIAIGGCFDSLYGYYMPLAAAMTKRIDAEWSSGTGNGGLATGLSLAGSTWYHLFLIYNITSGAVDAGFDTVLDASNLLGGATGFTKYRHIGSVLTTSGSAIIPFIYNAGLNYIEWKTPVLDWDFAPGNTNSVNKVMSVPLGLRVKVKMNVSAYSAGSGNCFVYIRNPDVTDGAPSETVAPLHSIFGCGSLAQMIVPMECITNAASEIAIRSKMSTAYSLSIKIATLGYEWNRGW